MSRLTRDGTAEPVSRDQILRHARGQGNIHFPCSADHEQDWQPYLVDPYSAICDDYTYIHTYIHTCFWSALSAEENGPSGCYSCRNAARCERRFRKTYMFIFPVRTLQIVFARRGRVRLSRPASARSFSALNGSSVSR